jgi:hypothetical protein
MVACGISMYSYICIVAPHLGTLAEMREGCSVEPNPKTVFGGTIPKMEVLGDGCLTNTDLVLDPKQAPEYYKPPNFWNAIKYYVIYIVALSGRCWMKTLVALLSNPCPDIITWILCSSELSRLLSPALSGRSRVISCHLRAIGLCIWHGWLYLLSWKRTGFNLNKDRVEPCRCAVTPSVSIKDWFLEPFLFMLNACLSLSWPGLETDHEAE